MRRRRWLRIAALLLAAGALGIAGLAAAWVVTDFPFFRRMFTYPEREVTDVAWYEPRAVVRGRHAGDLPVATEPDIRPEALEAARRWAHEKNASALLVLHGGEIVLEEYWRGHHRDAHTNSMSMAKTIVGLLAGIALSEGSIPSLDTPAATYLREWADDERASITVRHLLAMTSGLGNASHHEDPFTDVGYLYLGTDSRYIVRNATLRHEPGSRFEYNSINTQALAFVLEAATGVPYPEYLARKLWGPIGARDATVWLDTEGGAAKAFCCLFASARDWARVGLLFQDRGEVGGRRVVPGEWIGRMTTPSALEPDYGYHIWTGVRGDRADDCEAPFLAPDVVYIDGRHKQRVYVVPSARLVVVRVGENARGWDDCVLVNTLLRGIEGR